MDPRVEDVVFPKFRPVRPVDALVDVMDPKLKPVLVEVVAANPVPKPVDV